MTDPSGNGPHPRAGGFALFCDPDGVARELLLSDGVAPAPVFAGGRLLDCVDPDSRAKMENFLGAARRTGPAVGWEMNVPCPGGLLPMAFAAVPVDGGLIVAAASSAARLAGLLSRLEALEGLPGADVRRSLTRAVQMAWARAEEDEGLIDELTRLNNEAADFQRELSLSKLALGRQKEWLWDILASIEDAVLATDTGGKITFLNRSAELLTGRDLAGASGAALEDLVRLSEGPGPEAAAVDLGPAWGEGRTIAVQGYLLREKPRVPVPVSGVAGPILGHSGPPIGGLVLLRDTTSALRVQQLMVESERMAVAAEMAAGMAHTVNNMLFVISGNAEALAPHLPRERLDRLDSIRTAVHRIAELTTRLMTFTDSAGQDATAADLNDIVRTALSNLGTCPPEVQVHLALSPAPILVPGSADKLVGAVGSILSNAREALHGPGSIEVTTCCDSGAGPESEARAVLRITDDGEGMAPEVKRRLFTPFVSTRFLGRGLGLATARATVAAHGGHIEVESAQGKGTRVTISLPTEGPVERGG